MGVDLQVGSEVTVKVKPWYMSQTVWSGILQSAVGFLMALILMLNNGVTPESLAAVLVGLKGFFDVCQRFLTTQPIK